MMQHGTILYLDDVSVTFDGFQALRRVSLYVDRGEIRALIGPNGAGKTTLLDVICGHVKPAQGRVVFGDDTDLVGREPYQIAALGIGRKFQTPSVFKHLTLFENLLLSLPQRWDLWSTLFGKLSTADSHKISHILETLGVQDKAHQRAGALSHGETQWLEIGMVMAQEPALLLLDEPVAGMTAGEREKTAELLQRLAQHHAVLVVEHDMEFVRQTAQKVTVLHEGAVLCEGSVDRIQHDPRVIEVYLGRGYHADAQDSGAQHRVWRQPDSLGR